MNLRNWVMVICQVCNLQETEEKNNGANESSTIQYYNLGPNADFEAKEITTNETNTTENSSMTTNSTNVDTSSLSNRFNQLSMRNDYENDNIIQQIQQDCESDKSYTNLPSLPDQQRSILTAFAVGILSKLLKFKDIFLALISTFLSIVSRGVYFLSTDTYGFFCGAAIDFTFSVKFLAVRSIISKIVPSEDLSTMFAVMGLFEALAGFIFPYIYPTFYEYLLSSTRHDIAEIFLLSGGLLIVVLCVYLYVWNLLKRKENDEAVEESNDEDTKL